MTDARRAPRSTTPPSGPRHDIRRSAGVLVAPFADGAVATDLVEEVTHVVDRGAAWLLTATPTTVDALVRGAVATTGSAPAAVADDVRTGIERLEGAGLLGRHDPVALPPAPQGSPLAGTGSRQGAVHAVHDHRVAFRSSDVGLLAQIDGFLGTVAPDDRPASLTFDVERSGGEGVTLTTAHTWAFPTSAAFFHQLPSIVNEYATQTDTSVVVHGGAVRTPAGEVVLVIGDSDAGKSTLVGALVLAGSDYLGDESIAVRHETLAAVGHPKRLGLSAQSCDVLGIDPSAAHVAPTTLRSDVEVLSGEVGPIGRVVLVEHRPGAAPTMARLDPNEAIRVLVATTLNLRRAGEPGLETLCLLAERVSVLHLVHGDAVAASRAVLGADREAQRHESPSDRLHGATTRRGDR